MKSNNDNPMSKSKRRNTITHDLLKSLDIPNGGAVAVYDRLSRRALFYRNSNGHFNHILTRDKRGAPIVYRDNDMIASLDYDGTLIYGDPFHAFISESENQRTNQTNA